MTAIVDSEIKSTTNDPGIDLAYLRFDPQSTYSTCSTVVVSSCSDDEEHEKNNLTPPIKWKRQKILNKNHPETLTERPSTGSNDVPNNLHIDRNSAISAKENVAYTLDEELRSIPPRRLPPIPEDKLHRRNPHTVRQEIKMFDTPISDTSLADVHLSEMPGLHNTEQWKRIAGRAVHASPPLSRQYYQTIVSTIESQNGQVPQPLGSYRRPGRSENDEERPITPASPWRTPRRRIFFGSSIAVVVVAIIVAVVLAITLIQKTGQPTTNYYSGSVYVNARFDQMLSDPSSSLARTYRKDLCTLIGTTLADSKTKYALFYSTCSVYGFRNGSIIADFVLGFIRSQNATRLSAFLNRSLVNKSLFGGPILSVSLNISTVPLSNNTNTTGNSTNDYDDDNSEYDDDDYDDDGNNPAKLIMSEQNQTNDQRVSTLEDLTTHDSSTSSTISLNEETLLKSSSTFVNDLTPAKREIPPRPTKAPSRPPPKSTPENSVVKPPPRLSVNTAKRQRRMVIPKNQRRLLQYELMPTGKVYYVDRPFHGDKKITTKDDTDENSSVVLSTILSRSSSLDTLSDKHYRRRQHSHHQQQNRKEYQDFTLRKPEQKLTIGGRLASSNNLPESSPFKPINIHKKKRFSSFEPTPESLDRVFDVLIAADKRREEHEFWREKFDQRQPSNRVSLGVGRMHEPVNSNTIPSFRSKLTQGTSNMAVNNPDSRSQSYTAKRNSTYEHTQQQQQQQGGCLLEDCLRRRTLLLQHQQPQQQQQQQPVQRNYSPNIIYSTNYPKQQLPPTSKPPVPIPPTTSNPNQPPIRILPLSNGRIGRAPQARQTSDELSSVSDVWATRSSLEDESHYPKKSANRARFQSAVNRHRLIDQKPIPPKRATSVEQQKTNRIQTKTTAPSKNKFFDLFKFNR